MSLTSLSSLSDPEDIPHRYIPDRINLLSKYNGEEFRVKYRVSKETAIQISHMLNLEPITQRNKSVDGLTQLLICLRFFATGNFPQVLGDVLNVHKSTVCRIVQRVSRELAKLHSTYIKMPTEQDIREVAEGFYAIDGFPRVGGALDCTQVKLITRVGSLSELYRCKKGYFSLNVQVVCDASLKIRDIIARWPGSVNSDTIFNNSHLCADFEKGKYGHYVLLGDSEYFNKKYLMTPVLNPQTNAEKAYNKCHAATHNSVERCLRVWKQRCPCLEKGITLNKTSTILQVIVASAVFHNMCIELDEAAPPNDFYIDYQSNDFSIDIPVNIHSQETSIRSALINTVFS